MGFWERYRPKPVWRSEYREAYLEQVGRNFLFVFILSIALNPFYVLFLSDKTTLNYVVVEDPYINNNLLYKKDFTYSQQQALDKYRLINKEELQRINEFEERTGWIIITALLGWCITSPRFMKGWPKLIKRLS